MEFSWTEEQLVIKEEIRKFASRELNAEAAQRDSEAIFSTESWKKCAEMGLLGLPVPRAYGGTELDQLTVVLAMESLGYGCRDNGLLFALGAQMWSVQMPILNFGTEQQKARFLPALVSGSIIGAHAVTEPEAGSDVFSLRTSARKDGDFWILNGTKTFITNAPVAGVFVVVATLNRDQGPSALAAFLIERDAPGLCVQRHFDKMGLRTAPLAEVVFDDCRVRADCLLGTAGGGATVFATAMEWERAFILAPALGTMQRLIDQCLAYASTRRQFGKPIAKFEPVARKIVDMDLRVQNARLLTYRTAWMKSTGKRLGREPSQVKLYLSECWVQTCLDSLQIHGAQGYMVESGLERELRDALASKIYSGTSEIQQAIIARYLGLL